MIIQTSTRPVTTRTARIDGQDHHHRLDREQGLALGQDVGEDAGEQPEDHDREELRGGDDAEPERVAASAAGPARPGRPAASTCRRARWPGRRRTAGSCGGGTRDTPGAARPASAVAAGFRAGSPSAGCAAWPPSSSARWRDPGARRRLGVVDHRVEAGGLGLEQSRSGARRGRAPRGGSARRSAGSLVVAEALAIALAGGLVLEQLADLGQREPGVVAQAADEPQALEVGGVEQPVVAVGPGRGLEQPDLLVVADRASRQAGLGGDLLDPEQSGGIAGCGGASGHLPPIVPQPSR